MDNSWSMSSSYISNGSIKSQSFYNRNKDGENIFEEAYEMTEGKDVYEKFYKKKSKPHEMKLLLGKSKNKEKWKTMENINGNKEFKEIDYEKLSQKYLDSPSKKHRFDNQSYYDTNHKIKKKDSWINDFENMKLVTNYFDDEFFIK